MNIVFFGAVKFSAATLQHLIHRGDSVVGVCSGPASFGNADFADLEPLASAAGIPVRKFDDANHPDTLAWVTALQPDVIFCFGWSRLIRRPLLELPPLGIIGFHPSLLPANRGRHPLIWALVCGLTETGSTFFFMNEEVDSGDILSQERIGISKTETAGTLYEKVVKTALRQMDGWIPALAAGIHTRRPQVAAGGNLWRKRTERDGEIDWRMTDEGIYNLVRALSRPYPGARFRVEQKSFTLWNAERVSAPEHLEPGKVLSIGQGGAVIKAGRGAVRLLETEPPVALREGQYL